ncbi:hypothetical protein BH11BAC1_BH11BAC1_12930 [soil metagenome]
MNFRPGRFPAQLPPDRSVPGLESKMKNKISYLLTLVLIVPIIGFKSPMHFEPVAVIELFTSQGCSSCPAADKLLSQTINDSKKDGRKIIALSFHVDYWNHLGWSDPFSDKIYSQRQRAYASTLNLRSVYTPQMIVNGMYEFVGSSAGDLGSSLDKALRTEPTTSFKMISATTEGNLLRVKYELEGNYSGCNINLALVSKKEITSVRHGENDGRKLTNENVVRSFMTREAQSSGELMLENSTSSTNEKLAVIAYIQQSDLKIVGAAMAELR